MIADHSEEAAAPAPAVPQGSPVCPACPHTRVRADSLHTAPPARKGRVVGPGCLSVSVSGPGWPQSGCLVKTWMNKPEILFICCGPSFHTGFFFLGPGAQGPGAEGRAPWAALSPLPGAGGLRPVGLILRARCCFFSLLTFKNTHKLCGNTHTIKFTILTIFKCTAQWH